LSTFSGGRFFLLLVGFLSLFPGFPPLYDSYVGPQQEYGEEAVQRQPYIFPPPPTPSDPTTSPAATYRPESTHLMQFFPQDLIDHPPPSAPLPSVATAATRRR
jgi:hypothetical protein